MRSPKLCGRNNINIPTGGCDDCGKLEQRIEEIEEWINTPLTAQQIEDLTPIECYVPPCADSRADYGEACCAIVGC